MKRGMSALILMALLLAVAACGGGSEEATVSATPAPAGATQPAPQEPPPAATATPVPPTATPVPPTPTPETEEEEALDEEQLAALDALDSYRMVVAYDTKGTNSEGKPVDDSVEIISEYTKDPEVRRMAITFVDNINADVGTNTMETYQIGDDMYMYAGEEMGWMRVSTEESPFSDPEMSMLVNANIFGNLKEMQRVRPDQRINGIDSRHYQFDEKVLGKIFGDRTDNVSASGDIWIAKDGGFVTKYLLTVAVEEGAGGVFDASMVEGTLEMSFELQDVNEDIKIELPEEAIASASLAGFGEQPFPTPPNSRVQSASAAFTMIESDTPVAEVIAFYQQALPDLGWTQDESGSMSFGDMASLAFTKDDLRLSVLISSDSSTGKTQVIASSEQ